MFRDITTYVCQTCNNKWIAPQLPVVKCPRCRADVTQREDDRRENAPRV